MERIHHGTPYWDQYYHEHRARYAFAAAYVPGKRVLDAACGTGYGSAMLRAAGAAHVTGVDISAEALGEARAHHAQPGLDFRALDVGHLDALGTTFDVVVSFETIEHLADAEGFLAAVCRVLAPGGVFLCSSPNRDFAGGGAENPFHLDEMDYATFRRRFEAHFVLTASFHQSPTPMYRRWQALARATADNARVLGHSRLLRLENQVRRWLGRAALRPAALDPALFHTAPGDYPICPLDAPPGPSHLTFLFVGTPHRDE